MGFLSNFAVKGELRTMAVVDAAITAYTNLDHGPIEVPCHIISEVHQAIYVGRDDPESTFWIGVYRCQGHYWGVELTPGNVDEARRGKDVTNWIRIASMQGERVADLGPMSTGAGSLAFALSTIDYS